MLSQTHMNMVSISLDIFVSVSNAGVYPLILYVSICKYIYTHRYIIYIVLPVFPQPSKWKDRSFSI